MDNIISNLIDLYKNRIVIISDLILNGFGSDLECDKVIAEINSKREFLVNSLSKILAKNCSLRKKDFNGILEKLQSVSKERRKEIEDERKKIRNKLREYLGQQEKLSAALKEEINKIPKDSKEYDGKINEIIAKVRSACQNEGEEILTLIRHFQINLSTLEREEEEINNRLQRLVERGELLRTEDIRKIKSVREREHREAERQIRREDIERLLEHFKYQRMGKK
jgi:chromosome segregation ATPase